MLAKNGLMMAIEQIWERYRPVLLPFIRRRVPDEATAEDILQEVFVRVVAGLDTLRDGSRLESWLFQIARNQLTDYYRRQRDTEMWVADELAAEPEAEAGPETILANCLPDMLTELPLAYRTALEQVYFQGLTGSEIANRQALSVSGVKSRVQRGRALLRARLEACCRPELDRTGRIIDFQPQCSC